MELVSILMPVYNVESYLSESIESILNQTYENIEFVIIDDCSSDGTYEVCKKYAAQDSRIVLLHNTENLKIEGSLNRGLKYCHGKYVLRMDGDDFSFPDRIEKLKTYLDEHKDVVLVGSSVEITDAQGKHLGNNTFLGNWNEIQKTCTLKFL